MINSRAFYKAYSQVKDSQIKKEAKLSYLSDIEKSGKLFKESQPTDMGPLKQSLSLDNHNSNFALVNYESNQETLDNHVKNDYNTLAMKSIHWTDRLEIIVVVAIGIFAIKQLRNYFNNKKKKKHAKAQSELITQLQSTIPMSPPPVNPTFASAPVQMML